MVVHHLRFDRSRYDLRSYCFPYMVESYGFELVHSVGLWPFKRCLSSGLDRDAFCEEIAANGCLDNFAKKKCSHNDGIS
ncbi:hypothetical protein CTI12_AA160530 [Artemisia annua]|uniref:Uncharacterized protein n=1 Tax=Artemisia annua TaxID=35608 RepID=A0A2U1PES6_ARTAN|nr:hypothetical protein CTI12_AA160530 [Artemisia annua]